MTEPFPERPIRAACAVLHTDSEGNTIPCPGYPHVGAEPTRLTREQLVPIVTAIHRREQAMLAGAGLLAPWFSDCPTCGQQPNGLIVNGDHPADFLEDRVRFGFRPCGHNFTADGEDLARAYDIARREAQ